MLVTVKIYLTSYKESSVNHWDLDESYPFCVIRPESVAFPDNARPWRRESS